MHDMMESVEKFVRNTQFQDFVADEKTRLAIMQALEIIGEAAKNVPEPMKSRYPEIPWRAMARLRDRLIHWYFGVDLKAVWQTATVRVPSTRPLVKAAIEAERQRLNP